MLRVSVKQLEMAHSCPRKWAFHYLEGIPQLEGEALSVGNAVHHDMKCLTTGQPPKHGPETYVGKMCRALLPYAENRSGQHQSEIVKLVELPEYDLKVDLRADYLDKPVFKDWKTTGAPYKTATIRSPGGGKKFWAKQTLENDFQANIYAFLLMRSHWFGTLECDAQWVFVSKKFKRGQEPKVWTVEHHFAWNGARDWFQKNVLPVAELIRSMRQMWAEKQLDQARLVPHNAKSCEGVGLFCDASGHCGFIKSPVMDYNQLHLPVIQ